MLPPGKTMTFAQLLRRSAFARYDPQLRQIIQRSPYPLAPDNELPFEAVQRPALFGLKCEPPSSSFGTAIDAVQFQSFEGQFEGFADYKDASDRAQRLEIIREMQHALREASSVGFRLPGRILNSCEGGGFVVGIGPVRALLPASEIPATVSFSPGDLMERKAFYFTLRSVTRTAGSRLPRQKSEACDILTDSAALPTSKFTRVSYSQLEQEQGYSVLLSLRQ